MLEGKKGETPNPKYVLSFSYFFICIFIMIIGRQFNLGGIIEFEACDGERPMTLKKMMIFMKMERLYVIS